MEKKTKHALLIGKCTHTSSEEDGFFTYKERWNTAIGWVCDRTRQNGFYFDKEEELKAFEEKVTEYAKALYQEYLKDKKETE